ncbi:MAG: hypothetical protein ABSF10_11965 [Verrucomicrobiota bacterium]|jgi:hypothetical protein
MKIQFETGSDGVMERWSAAKAKQVNTEHPTSNIQQRMKGCARLVLALDVRCWMLDVGCSHFSS